MVLVAYCTYLPVGTVEISNAIGDCPNNWGGTDSVNNNKRNIRRNDNTAPRKFLCVSTLATTTPPTPYPQINVGPR
jgi:hypothetical protein